MTMQDQKSRRLRITRFQRPHTENEEERGAEPNKKDALNEPPPPKALQVITYLYGFWLIALVALGYLGTDIFWWGAYNQYLPQWVWGVPVLVLLVWFWKSYRQGTWLPCLMLLWVIFPVMDFRWSMHNTNLKGVSGTHLRVLTYNVKNGHYGQEEMTRNIQEAHADIILLQQSHGTYKDSLAKFLQGWNTQVVNQYVFATKYPILEAELRDLSVSTIRIHALRCRLKIKERVVTVYTVHLLSPRSGLNALRNRSERFLERMMDNNQVRQIQAIRLGNYLKQEFGPVLLAGDLNAPVQSMLYQEMTDSNLYNAFNAAGRGYGYTFGHISPARHDFVRIDHIFLSREWVTLDCWTGSPVGSDHRPLIADLFLPDR